MRSHPLWISSCRPAFLKLDYCTVNSTAYLVAYPPPCNIYSFFSYSRPATASGPAACSNNSQPWVHYQEAKKFWRALRLIWCRYTWLDFDYAYLRIISGNNVSRCWAPHVSTGLQHFYQIGAPKVTYRMPWGIRGVLVWGKVMIIII